jgi:ATP-binding cassette subfamily F protein uup
LDGQGGANFYADLAQWEDRTAEMDSPPPEIARPAPDAPREDRRPLSTRELKELKGMEDKIHAAEERHRAALAALEDPAVASDAAELIRRHETADAVQEEINALFRRWEELEARR